MFIHVLRPRLAVFLCLLLTVICGLGLPGLGINSDTRVFFSDSNEHRQSLDRFEQLYSSQTNLVIALHADEGDVFSEDRLRFIRALTDEAWRLPYTTRVDSIANAVRISSDEEGIFIADMVTGDEVLDVGLVRSNVLSDPLLLNRLVSMDGKTTAVNVNVQYPEGTHASDEVIEAAEALLARLAPEHVGFTVWKTGRVASSHAFSVAAKKDLKTLTPIAYLAIGLLVAVFTRSISFTLALFATIILSIVSTLGLAGWVGHQINAATSSAPTIILSLGVACLMHLGLRILSTLREGRSRQGVIDQAIRKDFKPIALTLTTTAIGFLTLNFADAPPFRQAGNIVAVGAIFSLIYGMVFLPALLCLVPLQAKTPPQWISRSISSVTDMIFRHPRKILLVGNIVGLVLIVGIFRIEIDDNYVEYFSPQYEFRRDTDNIQTHLTGLDQIEFDLAGTEAEAVLDPAYFAKLDAFETWLRAQSKVIYVSHLGETFKRLNMHMNSGLEADRTIPDSREALAQYLLLYEMSLPFGRSINDQITIDHSGSRVTVIMQGASTKEVRQLKQDAEAWLTATEPLAIAGQATGLAVMYAYLSSLNIEGMTLGTVLALVLISAILIFAFRSIRCGIVSLVPNLLPIGLAMGVWGFMVGEVGVSISAVGACTLGIIVDDTVHLFWRFLEARRNGATAENAIREMFRIVGPAMLISSTALIIGFSIIATSGFHITSSLGALTAITISFALLCDWLLLPAILLIATQKSEPPAISKPEELEVAEPVSIAA